MEEMNGIVKERIEKNKKLFSEEENKILKENIDLYSKVYLLGVLDISFKY